jgi:hypothetical protein
MRLRRTKIIPMVCPGPEIMGSLCRLVGFVMATLIGAGCGGPATPVKESSELLRNYAKALRDGDALKAWVLLDEQEKRETSFEAFSFWVKTHPTDVRRLAEQLEHPGGPDISATLFLGDNDRIEFVEHGGTFKIRLSSLEQFSQLTPLLSLKSFVLAIKQQRYDVVFRFLPKSERKDWSEKKLKDAFEGVERARIAALVRAIEHALPQGKVEVLGSRATFDLGADSQLTLVLEDGAWTIEDYVPIIR